MNLRHILLGAAFIITLLTVWWAYVEERKSNEELVTTVMPASAPNQAIATTSLDRERMHEADADLFPTKDWNPPPVVKNISAKPAHPLPPPFPYRYLGLWEENGTQTLILGREDGSIPVHPGQILGGVWRIEKISTTGVEFTYLPLKTPGHLILEKTQ